MRLAGTVQHVEFSAENNIFHKLSVHLQFLSNEICIAKWFRTIIAISQLCD